MDDQEKLDLISEGVLVLLMRIDMILNQVPKTKQLATIKSLRDNILSQFTEQQINDLKKDAMDVFSKQIFGKK